MQGPPSASRSWIDRVRAAGGRIWLRLLLVNLMVLLVPAAGLEFARIYERQLLRALERDMNDQAALTRAVLEDDLRNGLSLGSPRHRQFLSEAARSTRTRIRVLDREGKVLTDSHAEGAPEGPEPAPPALFRSGASPGSTDWMESNRRYASTFPPIAERGEVKAALGGRNAAETRVARRPRAVFLFTATPLLGASGVAGAVYVTRSTAPVLEELHRIRTGLFKVLGVGLGLGAAVTLLLALSISRPLGRLSRAAKRIAAGERGVAIPRGGSGEIRELSDSFGRMTEQLDARLDYISEFAADVAHEFKSPLTSIRGAAELLSEGAFDDPVARERFLRNILLDTERLDRLVSRLLVLSRIEASAAELTLVDLCAVLTSEIERTRERERGQIDLAYGARHTWVRGREGDLRMAIGNLLDNALRYAPPDTAVKVATLDDGSGILLTVADEGPGIAPARRAKIFDRFYTTEAERGGSGLGLSIVHSVARTHGGLVSVDSEVGQGSRFSLWLPRGDGAGST